MDAGVGVGGLAGARVWSFKHTVPGSPAGVLRDSQVALQFRQHVDYRSGNVMPLRLELQAWPAVREQVVADFAKPSCRKLPGFASTELQSLVDQLQKWSAKYSSNAEAVLPGRLRWRRAHEVSGGFGQSCSGTTGWNKHALDFLKSQRAPDLAPNRIPPTHSAWPAAASVVGVEELFQLRCIPEV